MKKIVAYKLNTTTNENLPFPVVLYPGFYGAFFAFKKDQDSKAYFCSCSYEAIENYIRIRKLSPVTKNVYAHKMYLLSSGRFPISVVEDLMKRKVAEDNIISQLNFGEKLCHECNLQTPSLSYCHEMYGGTFMQNYGWYANKQALEWGINPPFMEFLPDRCPDDILNEMKIVPSVGSIGKFDLFFIKQNENRQLVKDFQKQNRKIHNIIEDEVRRKFGHKKVGEAWTSETILYYIVKKLFPQYNIKRHYRPDFLEGLELDIYIEELKVGIEYQGIQHYKPIKHWGGAEALEKGKERDRKKKQICKDQNIPLIYFEYTEGLSDDLVSQKLVFCK